MTLMMSLTATPAEIRAVSCGKESICLQDLQKQAKEDHTYQLLMHYIQDVFQITEANFLMNASTILRS